MTGHTQINLVVAHALEAKPLCAMLNLRVSTMRHSFPLYGNDEGTNVIVSGIGKLAAAAATSYLAGLQAGTPASAWLNVGIAGHQQADIGAGLLAHKIVDAHSGATHYPPQLLSGFTSTTVITVDAVETNYPELAAYDMEASGFYASASRFSTTELVQVFKVVSDNAQHGVAHFQTSQVAPLISAQRESLTDLLEQLRELLATYHAAYRAPAAYETLLARYRFTASQQAQLRRLCERYHALDRNQELRALSQTKFKSRKQLLAALALPLEQLAGT